MVVAHFRCSGTHLGDWLGIAPTGRRFEQVDEIYVFRVRNGRLASAIGVEAIRAFHHPFATAAGLDGEARAA